MGPHSTPVDEILEQLVKRVADVEVAIGIGRAVVECERRSAAVAAQLLIDLLLGPVALLRGGGGGTEGGSDYLPWGGRGGAWAAAVAAQLLIDLLLRSVAFSG
eukprot:291124-Chlamydomonas_euryale.AAC.1